MDWYKTLTIDQKINLKILCKNICGASFTDLNYFFSLKDKINLIYGKLRLEGYDI